MEKVLEELEEKLLGKDLKNIKVVRGSTNCGTECLIFRDIINNEYLGDAICHPGSYGYPNHLEIMGEGLLTADEKEIDSVKGYLSVREVTERVITLDTRM